jgi:hypothetical protein
MKIHAIKCNKCHAVVFSRARHDFATCNCVKNEDSCFVDGGQGNEYVRYGGSFDHVVLEADVTVKELIMDWNHREDKYLVFDPELPQYKNWKCVPHTVKDPVR